MSERYYFRLAHAQARCQSVLDALDNFIVSIEPPSKRPLKPAKSVMRKAGG